MQLLKLTQLALAFAIATAAAGPALATERDRVSAASDESTAMRQPAKFSEAQLAEMQARAQFANTIVQNVAADAQAKGATESWRIGLLSSLFSTPSANLRNIAMTAHTLDQAHELAATAKTQAPVSASHAKSLGSSSDSLVFNPKTPCRFIDTRNVGGPISSPRTFDTALVGPSYGGDSACTLPSNGEPAFAANVTVVVSGTVAGYIGIRPTGSTNVTSFLNWPTGGTSGLANSGIITTALSGGDYQFEVFEAGSNPQVILDYFGYFSAEAPASLDCTSAGPGHISVPAGSGDYYSNHCPAGYNPIAPYCWNEGNVAVTTTGSGVTGASAAAGASTFCTLVNSSSAVLGATVNATCCRIP